MKYRKLGEELEVSALGLGCMPMAGIGTGMYGQANRAESLATIDRAIELGVTFFDTAEVYGPHINEELLGQAIRGRRERLIVATKFGFAFQDGKMTGVDSSPANIRRACEGYLNGQTPQPLQLTHYAHHNSWPQSKNMGHCLADDAIQCLRAITWAR